MSAAARGERIALPTWRLAAAAAVLAMLPLIVPADPRTVLIGANAALLAVALVDAARTPAPQTFAVSREHPGVIPLDGAATLRWTVANPTARAVRLAIADELAPALGAERRRAALQVPAGGRATATTTLLPRRRGRQSPQRVTVRVRSPLGLSARQGDQAVPGLVRVYPSFRSRREAELRITRSQLLEVGLRSARGRGSGTDFEALRDYTVDDEFRRIDWAASARTGRPIVRTYREERNQTVLALLDTGRLSAGRVGEGELAAPRLEHAMDAVLALTTVATRLGDRAGLVAFSDRIRGVVGPSHARGQLGRIGEALYTLEPELVESDYRGALAGALGRFRRRALLVLLTDLSEPVVEEGLRSAVAAFARHHLLVVAGVGDPTVGRWAQAVPTEAGTVYRKAAAIAALQARQRCTARLRAAGATVVDAPPVTLAGALADTYLEIKATGRL